MLERLWGGPETLIVVSSDLSHYLPYDDARRIDARHLRDDRELAADLNHEEACGGDADQRPDPRGARGSDLAPELLDLRNSGDTAGDRDRVVGYAAFAFHEEAPHVG